MAASGRDLIGYRVKDEVTGFTGTAMGHVAYISGCNQLLVQPAVGADGKVPDSIWIDEQRLSVIPGTPRIVLKNDATPGFDKTPPVR